MAGCGGCKRSAVATSVADTYVGVRFAEEGNPTLCTTPGIAFALGDEVIVEVGGEATFGHVEHSPATVGCPSRKARARRILRAANADDRAAFRRQREQEAAARQFCQERSRALKLDMKIARVSFALSLKRATVHFSAEGRVDFRQLVREFSQRFAARVQMAQAGARDEARGVGGLGVCGRILCCSGWLNDFKPISIQMAKRQGLSLNPAKISGQCGRLLCCLAYEDEEYKRDGGRSAPPLPVIP